jgi:hypothetical protein
MLLRWEVRRLSDQRAILRQLAMRGLAIERPHLRRHDRRRLGRPGRPLRLIGRRRIRERLLR